MGDDDSIQLQCLRRIVIGTSERALMMREQIQMLRQEREQDRRQHERMLEDLRQDRDAWRAQAERQTLLLSGH
jgi:hypothetical protein